MSVSDWTATIKVQKSSFNNYENVMCKETLVVYCTILIMNVDYSTTTSYVIICKLCPQIKNHVIMLSICRSPVASDIVAVVCAK